MPGSAPFMTDAQLRQVKKLVRAECANYDMGHCVLLDDGYTPCGCPQLISYSMLCRWFRTAVLPLDKALYQDIMLSARQAGCSDCGQPFIARSNSARYCEVCAKRRRLQTKREWWHRKKAVKLDK